MPTEIETKALEALARAYDREEAAQMGEPSPWQQDDLDPAWVAERIACAEVGVEAYREARAALAGEKPFGAGVETVMLRTALLAVVAATRAYLPPDGIDAQECLNRILAATDNPTINPYILEAEHDRS